MKNKTCTWAISLLIGIVLGTLGTWGYFGQTQPNDVQEVEEIRLLFQQSAGSGTYNADEKKLTLIDVSPETTSFSDRPYRFADVGSTEDFVGHWGASSDSFESDPPNASLTFVSDGVQGSAVIELLKPNYDKDKGTLSYEAELIEGELPESFDSVSLFIDSKHSGPRFEIKNATNHEREFIASWASIIVSKQKIKSGKIGILPVAWACYEVGTPPAGGGQYETIDGQCLPGNNPIKLKYEIQHSYDRNGPTTNGYFTHRK